VVVSLFLPVLLHGVMTARGSHPNTPVSHRVKWGQLVLWQTWLTQGLQAISVSIRAEVPWASNSGGVHSVKSDFGQARRDLIQNWKWYLVWNLWIRIAHHKAEVQKWSKSCWALAGWRAWWQPRAWLLTWPLPGDTAASNSLIAGVIFSFSVVHAVKGRFVCLFARVLKPLLGKTCSHRITEWFGLERIFESLPVQPRCQGRGQLSLGHADQSPVQSDLERFHWWGIYNFSGQPIPVSYHPHNKNFFLICKSLPYVTEQRLDLKPVFDYCPDLFKDMQKGKSVIFLPLLFSFLSCWYC